MLPRQNYDLNTLEKSELQQIGEVYIYNANIDAANDSYKIENGNNLSSRDKSESSEDDLRGFFLTALNIAPTFLMDVLSYQQHHHSRPLNYSTVLLQQTIHLENQDRVFIHQSIIEPRLQKIFFLSSINSLGHRDKEKISQVNAWIVSIESPALINKNSGFNPHLSLICFSNEDALLVAKNINTFFILHNRELLDHKHIIPSYSFNEKTIDEVYDLAKMKLVELYKRLLPRIDLHESLKKKMLESVNINRSNGEVPDIHTFLVFLKKYTLTDIINNYNSSDSGIIKFNDLVIQYLQTSASLNKRYKENLDDSNQIIIGYIKDIQLKEQVLLNDVNAYMKAPIKQYIDKCMLQINLCCVREDISSLNAVKIKQHFLQDLNSAPFLSIYLSVKEKGAHLFGVDTDKVKEILGKLLKTTDMSLYVAEKLDQIKHENKVKLDQ